MLTCRIIKSGVCNRSFPSTTSLRSGPSPLIPYIISTFALYPSNIPPLRPPSTLAPITPTVASSGQRQRRPKMSPDPVSPKSAVYHHESDDRDMLESLRGLSIKGFHDWYARRIPLTVHPGLTVLVGDSHETPNANTPSSTNASLPTPPALRTSRVFLALPERPLCVTSSLGLVVTANLS